MEPESMIPFSGFRSFAVISRDADAGHSLPRNLPKRRADGEPISLTVVSEPNGPRGGIGEGHDDLVRN